MDGSGIPVPYSAENLHPPEVRLAAALLDNTSALVTGPDGTGAASLRAAAAHLAPSRTRVLRVGPPLDLPGFLDQVIRAGGVEGDTRLEQGFAALTDPGPSCDRIALLVEDAHLMPDATLRYIEFALHAGPHLCVAFAGQPGIAATLGLPGYAGLRKRLSLRLALPPQRPVAPSSPQPAAPMAALPAGPAAALPASAALARRQGARVRRGLAGAALAAGAAVLLWTQFAPPRSTGMTGSVQVQPAAAVPAMAPSAPGVHPTVAHTAAGDVAEVEDAEPAARSEQRAAAAIAPAADPDPAPSGTLAGLPSVPGPTAAPAASQPAGPGPAMALAEASAAIPDAAPDLPRPVPTDAPAVVPPAPSSQDGPITAAIAGLPPEPPFPEPSSPEPPSLVAPAQVPTVQAAPQSARPPAAPGHDSPVEAAIAGLRPEPTFAPVPPLPAPVIQDGPQVASPSAAPGQDGPVPATIVELPDGPHDPASMPPPPAPAVQATPQVAGPSAAPGHDGPTLAAIAGLPPASVPLQPAGDLLAPPQAGRRHTASAPRDSSAIQTAARVPNQRRTSRAPATHTEQAAARPTGPDLGYCRSLVLRAQLGEDLTHGDRMFMRNGCR